LAFAEAALVLAARIASARCWEIPCREAIELLALSKPGCAALLLIRLLIAPWENAITYPFFVALPGVRMFVSFSTDQRSLVFPAVGRMHLNVTAELSVAYQLISAPEAHHLDTEHRLEIHHQNFAETLQHGPLDHRLQSLACFLEDDRRESCSHSLCAASYVADLPC